MKYLLDTNACIQFITGRSVALKEKIEKLDISSLFICSVVRGELEYGARKSNNPEKTLSVLRSFISSFPEIGYDSAAAEKYGNIRANLEKKGTPIGPYDMQIAAIALANNFTLVTHNTKEFKRIDDILLEDWE
ncbi:MAG: type II toxin-antitoxin system VapC family toxin [Spirochaetes bacterium]|nr:type II toxin-antitoxin system VapC family toxin [Spirochaetota bacterium]